MYDYNMLLTIARIIFLTPRGDFKHLGYDWLSIQKDWESLSDQDRQPWINEAQDWLEQIRISTPDAYERYMQEWKQDQKNWKFDFI